VRIYPQITQIAQIFQRAVIGLCADLSGASRQESFVGFLRVT
jgi:hypothetical protein